MNKSDGFWPLLVAVITLGVCIMLTTALTVAVRATHETKMKRLEIVKVCITSHQPVEACRRLGSA